MPFSTLRTNRKTPLYDALAPDSKRHGETNDCAVFTHSLATGHTYNEAHSTLAELGRKPRKGTPTSMSLKALRNAGYKVSVITKGVKARNARTVRTLARILPTTGTFIITTAEHILCLRDGNVEDWTKNRWHRVKAVYFVRKEDEPEFAGYREPLWKSVAERGTVGETVKAAANEAWAEVDHTTDKYVIRAMRFDIMDDLVEAGFNRNTVSVMLGKWWAEAKDSKPSA